MAGLPECVAVVAMARNRVIGDGSGMLWHIPADLRRVREFTMGCPLVMGRHTWESIGRPLPGRASIVLTRDAGWGAEGAARADSMDHALAQARDWIAAQPQPRNRIVLFGGGDIYALGLRHCDRIEMTRVELEPDGGPRAALFPEIDPGEWGLRATERVAARGDVPAHSFESYARL